jgi:hypothetical protein
MADLLQGSAWGQPSSSWAIRTPALKRWDSTSGVLRMLLLAIDPYLSALVHQYSGESANLLGNNSEPSQRLTSLSINTNPHSAHQPLPFNSPTNTSSRIPAYQTTTRHTLLL